MDASIVKAQKYEHFTYGAGEQSVGLREVYPKG